MMIRSIIFLLIINFNVIHAQNSFSIKKIDSLITILNDVNVYEDLGEQEMLRLSTEVYYQSKEIQYKKGMVKSLVLFSNIYLEDTRGNYHECLNKVAEGLPLAEEIGDYESSAYLFYYKGMVLFRLGYKGQAKFFFDKALEISSNIPDNDLKGMVKYNIYYGFSGLSPKDTVAELYYGKLMYNEAKKLSKKNIFRSGFIAAANTYIGSIYSRKKEYNIAETYLKDAEIFQKEVRDKRNCVSIYLEMGIIRQKQDRNEEALEYFLKAISLAKKYDMPYFLLSIYIPTSDVYGKLKDYEHEAFYLKQYRNLSDSINIEEKKMLRNNFKKINNEELAASSVVWYYLLAGLFFVIILCIIYIIWVDKKMTTKKYQEEQTLSYNMDGEETNNTIPIVNLNNKSLKSRISGLFKNGNKKALQFKDVHTISTEKKIDIVTTKELEELYQLAYENNLAFMQGFKQKFPIFSKGIITNYPNWVITELEVCFLLKLNLSTKEIAQITNSSIRSIESKKYRIRKKMNIPSQENISIWLNNLTF